MKSNGVIVTGERCSLKWKYEPCPAAKRSRQNITNSESLDRLIDLEEDRRERDNELIESIKSQNQSSKDKNDAIIAAAKAMEQASMAIFRKFSQN